MKTQNIIFGTLALAVVGGGAYFYFKNKSKKPFSEQLADSLTSTAGVSAISSTSTTTTDKVLDSAPVTVAQAQANQQETSNQIQAQAMASQITSLKSQFPSLKEVGGACYFSLNNIEQFTKCNVVKTQISDIETKMKNLGYKNDNGLAVKI